MVLGGTGGTGQAVCRWLLRASDESLVIAGRDLRVAEILKNRLSEDFPSDRIAVRRADAADYDSLVAAFSGARLAIDATTAVDCVQTVARAAIAAGADYLDYHYEQQVVRDLEAIRDEIERSGRCFITQAGFHPGLPAAFVRYGAPRFDSLRKAIIGMAMNADIDKPEAVYEIIDSIAEYDVDIFVKRKWRKATYSDSRTIVFGPRFGARTCYPLQMAEMRALPEMFPLEEAGVYVAGFNWFVDNIVVAPAILLYKIRNGLGRRFLARLFVFGINRFSGGARGVEFVLEAEGEKGRKRKKLRILAEHDDAYAFTAIPVVACIRQYLKGAIAPGLSMMGLAVEPDALMRDLEAMGVVITISER